MAMFMIRPKLKQSLRVLSVILAILISSNSFSNELSHEQVFSRLSKWNFACVSLKAMNFSTRGIASEGRRPDRKIENTVNEYLTETQKKLELQSLDGQIYRERNEDNGHLMDGGVHALKVPLSIDAVEIQPEDIFKNSQNSEQHHLAGEDKNTENVIENYPQSLDNQIDTRILRVKRLAEINKLQRERERAMFVKTFIKNAKAAGVEVTVDPQTLIAYPK